MAPAPQGPQDPLASQDDLDKPWWESKTFWAAVTATIGGASTVAGYIHAHQGHLDPTVLFGAATAIVIAWQQFFQRQGTVNAVKRATHKILANQPTTGNTTGG